MDRFINREPELKLIEDAFGDLLNKQTFLRTPIIDFYGVEGIGKTTMLKKVIQTCDKNKIRYIWADASKSAQAFFHEIIHQADQYTQVPSTTGDDKDLLDQSVMVTRKLLKEGPLVLLLDAVDTTDAIQIAPIETMLGDLIVNNELFVILTSRRSVSFERQRNVARKLTIFPLLPFDRNTSKKYLDSAGVPLDTTLREIIFEWTHGYPLAMNVMVKAIVEQKIDPRDETGRQALLEVMKQKVINEGILAHVVPAELPWFQTVLSLLSVPRRFNLVIMQNLIERFTPERRLANSLSYIVLPKRISQSTDVLSWNLTRGGFSIELPVRDIFLLQLKIERLQDFYEIHSFLAQLNQTNAETASGLDRIRYQREYLYHIASCGNDEQLPSALTATVQQIIKDGETEPEQLIQFLEEFIQDTELKELLGEQTNVVLALIYEQLSQQMYTDAMQEGDERKRVQYLQGFFYYTMRNPGVNDLPGWLKEHLYLLIEQEQPPVVLMLYEELVQDETFREALGTELSLFIEHIHGNTPPTEG